MNNLSIGQTLKQSREAQRLSREQVAETLRLGTEAIDALEEERWGSFPAMVYARGHLGSYARLLGLDPVALLRRMPQPDDSDDFEQDFPLSGGGVAAWVVGIAILAISAVILLLLRT